MTNSGESKKFSKESSIYVIGEFLSKAFTFILLPIYTSYLSIEDFAVYSIVAMIWPVILILLGKSFSAFILRGYFEYPDKKKFLGAVLSYSMVIGIVGTGIIHFTGSSLFTSIFKDYSYKPFLQYGVFFGLFRLFFTHIITIFRAKREPGKTVFLSIAQFAANAIAVIISIYILKTDLQGILNAQLIAYGFVTILYLIVARNEIRINFNSEFLLPALLFILPIQIHGIASWIFVYVSRIFIVNQMTAEDVAVFAVATQLAFILTVINNGLNQAWSPFVYANAEKEGFKNLFAVNARKLIVVSALTGTCLILFSRELLLLMGKTAYLQAQMVLPLLAAAYVFQMLYFLYVAIIIYKKNVKMLPILSISTGLICVIINIKLVPLLGLFGAAVSTAVSFGLMFAAVYVFSKRYIQVKVMNARAILFLILLVIISAVFYILGNSLPLFFAVSLKIICALSLIGVLDLLKIINIREFFRLFAVIK